MWKPDFERNTLRILRGEKAERVVLFDFFLNDQYYRKLAGRDPNPADELDYTCLIAEAMANAGYDYVPIAASNFRFYRGERAAAKTVSINDGALITDWESFETYPWRNPEDYDYTWMERIKNRLPEGMKLMVYGPDGLMENLCALIGYENMCIMLYDDPELLKMVADRIGETLVRYFTMAAEYDTVGFLCADDDWGFNTQTFLSPPDMRKYIFPWHKKIVEAAHAKNKPCILHSCGYFGDVIEDVIEDMKFDGRHSYEDKIIPVEKAYEMLKGRIAVLGGMDMDFMARKTPEEIYKRAAAMLDRARHDGGYMLGTGNSVPEYIPFENYMAMLRAGWEWR